MGLTSEGYLSDPMKCISIKAFSEHRNLTVEFSNKAKPLDTNALLQIERPNRHKKMKLLVKQSKAKIPMPGRDIFVS